MRMYSHTSTSVVRIRGAAGTAKVLPRNREHLCDSPVMYGKLVALQREIGRGDTRGALRAGSCRLALTELIHYGYSPLLRLEALSGRSHKETWAGCIVSAATPTRSSVRASRSASSRHLAEKVSRVFLASYLRR